FDCLLSAACSGRRACCAPMSARFFASAAGVLAASIIGASCGSSAGKNGFGGSGGPGGGDDASANDNSEAGFGGGDDAGASCDVAVTTCSSDLHSVLDCDGNVIEQCSADQGCANGGCVPACDSAKANKSTIGCEYYLVDPTDSGSCFA